MKIKFTREFYVPKGATKVSQKDGDGVAYLYEGNGKFCAVAFHGKAQKPDWHYSFKTEKSREQRIRDHFDGRRMHAELIANKPADKARYLKVGDILSSSWGYDQTNVDFYQVTKLIGKTMVELRAIKQDMTPTRWLAGNTSPQPGEFCGDPIRRKVIYDGKSVNIDDVRFASLWDGKALYYSQYA